ncbi:MAG: family N-acetyltransferase [Clostridia bacterium]|jgi:ribosomal protein S18 acetylase RimI-like enzyme|nr:family N-acetyltransferase [Clostridia bacterium]
MIYKKLTNKDIGEVAELIYRNNIIRAYNIGYCSRKQDKVYKETEELFYRPDSCFYGAYPSDKGNNSKLFGVLGFDYDQVAKNCEVWGPFIETDDEMLWQKTAKELWDKLLISNFEINKLLFFINVENQRCAIFLKNINAEYINSNFIAILERNEFIKKKSRTIEELTDEYYERFISLHDQLFSDAYYNGHDLINMQNPFSKIYIAKEKNGDISGYVCVDVNGRTFFANIEYLGINPEYKSNDCGVALLNEAIDWIFSFNQVSNIVLCVEGNSGALGLYLKTGFAVKDEFNFYSKNFSKGSNLTYTI